MIRTVALTTVLGAFVATAPATLSGQAGTVPPNSTPITGVVRDEAGRPIGGLTVLSCMSTVCLFSETDAAGRFTFHVEPPARIALKTLEDAASTPPRGAALVPVVLGDRRPVSVGTVTVPSMTAGAVLAGSTTAPAVVNAGDGLELSIVRAALKPPLGVALTKAAARRLPSAAADSYPAPPGEQVVAVYALHPFGTTSTKPIAVRAPVTLPDGTAVNFRTVNEIDGTWSAPAAGVVRQSVAVSDAGTGINELTYLVISTTERQ
jgi:hypothetical protein